MSIELEIKRLCAVGSLHQVTEGSPHETRKLYVVDRIAWLLEHGHGPHAAQLRQDVQWFLRGGLITVGWQSARKKNAMMKHLVPPPFEIWELRSIDPPTEDSDSTGGIRVFGRFAKKDTFIGLGWRERPLLGPPFSRAWIYRMKACEQDWENRFPGQPPFRGSTAHDYLSNAETI